MKDREDTKWLTMSEACQVTGRTDRTLRRWVKQGKVESKRDSKRVYYKVDISDTETDTGAVKGGHDSDMVLIQQLKTAIKEKDQQIIQQQAIIMQLSQEMILYSYRLKQQIQAVKNALA